MHVVTTKTLRNKQIVVQHQKEKIINCTWSTIPRGAPVDGLAMDSKTKRLVAIEGLLNGNASISYDCFAMEETFNVIIDALNNMVTLQAKGKCVRVIQIR